MKNSLKNIIIDKLSDEKFSGKLSIRYINGDIVEISRIPITPPDLIDKMKQDINFWKEKFRVLVDWEIEFDDQSEFKGQTGINTATKHAVIYGWDNETKVPKEYILHEIIHIAIRAVENDIDKDEILVQDLSKMLIINH